MSKGKCPPHDERGGHFQHSFRSRNEPRFGTKARRGQHSYHTA